MFKRSLLFLCLALNVGVSVGIANVPDRALLHNMFHTFLSKKISEQPRIARVTIPPHVRQIASIASSFAISYFIQGAISRNIMLTPEKKLMRSLAVTAAIHAAKVLGRRMLVPAVKKAAKKAHAAARGTNIQGLLSKEGMNLTPHERKLLSTQVAELLRKLSQEGILEAIEGGFDPYDDDQVAHHKQLFREKHAGLYKQTGQKLGDLIYDAAYGSAYSGALTHVDLAREIAAFVNR